MTYNNNIEFIIISQWGDFFDDDGNNIISIRKKCYLLKDRGKTATLWGGSPAGNNAVGALIVLLVLVGQGDGGNIGSQGGWGLQLQQADVVLNVEAVIVLVEDNGLDLDVLLVRVGLVEVVAADSNSQPAGRLSEKKEIKVYYTPVSYIGFLLFFLFKE